MATRTQGATAPKTPTLETALRAIMAEVTPGIRPYSTDSWLPDHLIEAAQAALAAHTGAALAAAQHAHNALSTASWHAARGEYPEALSRLRRAHSHITTAMEAGNE